MNHRLCIAGLCVNQYQLLLWLFFARVLLLGWCIDVTGIELLIDWSYSPVRIGRLACSTSRERLVLVAATVGRMTTESLWPVCGRFGISMDGGGRRHTTRNTTNPTKLCNGSGALSLEIVYCTVCLRRMPTYQSGHGQAYFGTRRQNMSQGHTIRRTVKLYRPG